MCCVSVCGREGDHPRARFAPYVQLSVSLCVFLVCVCVCVCLCVHARVEMSVSASLRAPRGVDVAERACRIGHSRARVCAWACVRPTNRDELESTHRPCPQHFTRRVLFESSRMAQQCSSPHDKSTERG